MVDTDRRTPLERASDFSWRYVMVLAAIYVSFIAIAQVSVVVIPILLALFLASVLSPPVQWLKRRGWSPIAATWSSIGLLVPIIAILSALLIPSFASGLAPLGEDIDVAIESATDWLNEGPLQLSDTEIQGYIDSALEEIRSNAGAITSGVLGGATVAFEVITGVVLTLLAAFFYLKDGDRAYGAVLSRVSNPERVGAGLTAAWRTLSSYVRGLATVGLIDATLIGIGLAIVGTPLALPLAMLVFFGAFFPIVGAFLSGLVAVAVSLANGGITPALIVLAIVVGVQQLEGHILYPIIFKRALALHPLVILVAIAIGGVAFGIIGAFLSVPITAVAVAVHQAIHPDPESSLISLMGTKPYQSIVDRRQSPDGGRQTSDDEQQARDS